MDEIVKALESLRQEINLEVLAHYSANDPVAFKVAAEIIGLVDAKIAELGGE